MLAGTAAGAGSEAVADVIVNTLYKGKSEKDLTEAEKQNVVFLSQLAGGLASGVIGDSTQSAAAGADIGKRAVENNFFHQVMDNPSADWQLIAKGQARKQEIIDAVYKDPEIVKAIEAGKTVSEILIDFTPVLGDLKSFSQAEEAVDYALATIGVLPIAGEGITALKGVKSAYKIAKTEELAGNIEEANKQLELAKTQLGKILRADNNFHIPINDKGNKKAYIDHRGNLVPVNVDDAASIVSHIRGGNSHNSPYVSFTDPSVSTNPKKYGENLIEIDVNKLKLDIKKGDLKNTEFISHKSVLDALNENVSKAEKRYRDNPTERNRVSLQRAMNDFNNAKRDGECLVKGCIPSEYIHFKNIK